MFNANKLRKRSLCIITAGAIALLVCTITFIAAGSDAGAEPGQRSAFDRALMFDPFTLQTIAPVTSNMTGTDANQGTNASMRDLLFVRDNMDSNSFLSVVKGPNPRIPQRPEWRSPMRPSW